MSVAILFFLKPFLRSGSNFAEMSVQKRKKEMKFNYKLVSYLFQLISKLSLLLALAYQISKFFLENDI